MASAIRYEYEKVFFVAFLATVISIEEKCVWIVTGTFKKYKFVKKKFNISFRKSG